jgi:hypothetical protein
MTLMLHVNATEVEYGALRELETPPATQSHVPIPHFRVVDLVKTAVGMYGHEIVGEHHGITEDGARYFGLLSLKSSYTGYEDTLGLRNSHDKSFPVGIGFGSRVFVCDNMAFIADTVIKRKHTANLKRDLPGLIGEIIEPLADYRERQQRTIDRYGTTLLTDERRPRHHADVPGRHHQRAAHRRRGSRVGRAFVRGGVQRAERLAAFQRSYLRLERSHRREPQRDGTTASSHRRRL